MQEYKTLIVGAGPCGLACAAELVRQGVDPKEFLLIDTNLESVKANKGINILPRTLELLDYYDDLGAKLVENEAGWSEVRFYAENQYFASLDVRKAMEKQSEYHRMYNVPQWKTELQLTDYLKSYGVNINRGISLESFEIKEDHVQVLLSNGSSLKVEYLVACDGAKSKIRKSLGLKYDGTSLKNGSVGLHFTTDGKVPVDKNLHMYYSEKGIAYMMEMANGVYVLGMDLTEEEETPYVSDETDAYGQKKMLPIPTEKAVELFHNRLGFKVSVKQVDWETRYRVHHRFVEKYSVANRVFLVGDAAHSSSPSAGLGLNIGIYEASNLGWKLAFTMFNLTNPSILETYDTERVKEIKKMIKFLQGQQDLGDMKGFARYIRNFGVSLVSKLYKVYPEIIGQNNTTGSLMDVHYQSTLTAKSTKANLKRMVPGRHVPNQLLKALGFDGKTKGYTVIVFGKDPSNLEPHLKSTGLIGNVIAGDSKLAREFEVSKPELFILRPDGHIGLRSESVNTQVCLNYLKLNSAAILAEL
ncbi:hypothetical protein HDV04_004928 [Boothiomyces sp. JEL0838]|nr:hypothetical protein HDV04_004912 [Boothiomyces sp. JEL0838]KAJ3310600.1 hypothetical protein HDV04_004928 [Boothiomyces sp. JEL0838]